MKTIRIGTRKSQLALWQAYYVKDQLLACHKDIRIEIVEIVSQGDKTLDIPLSLVGGKGLFLKELEQSLLDLETDIAVHSMKDVTVNLPDGLEIAVICASADPRDVFVSNHYSAIEQVPKGGVIGSCSLRRRCQIQAAFPHLEVRNLRGHVNTRLGRLDDGQYDALILAAAGLIRLEFHQRISQYLDTAICLPAVGQGAVGIECRKDDADIKALLAPLGDPETTIRISAERTVNERLGGGCHVPIAVFAEVEGDQMKLRGLVGELDGSEILRAETTGAAFEAVALGNRVADELLGQGAKDILNRVYEAGQ